MQSIIDFIEEIGTKNILATFPNATLRQLEEMATNCYYISKENKDDIHTDNKSTDTSNRLSDTCDQEFTPRT